MISDPNTLPGLNEPVSLTDEMIAAFQRDGHVCVRGLCDASEIDAYRPLLSGAVRDRAAGLAPLAERDTYGKAFQQISNLWQFNDALRRFVFAPRFAKVAAELLGVDGVRLYHDQALYKEAGGGLTPWHQDQHYWPLATDNTITMWMPLVPVDEAMGTMNFASGSHANGYLGDMPISDDSEAALARYIDEKGYPRVNHGAMQPGDATFHYGWTLHGAGGNQGSRMREVMTIIYFEDGARVSRPDNANREADLQAWLQGCEPGGPANGPLNPLLYPV